MKPGMLGRSGLAADKDSEAATTVHRCCIAAALKLFRRDPPASSIPHASVVDDDQASVEHVGEPLLTPREVARALEERRRCQRRLRKSRREKERDSLETCLKGPGEVGARCAPMSRVRLGLFNARKPARGVCSTGCRSRREFAPSTHQGEYWTGKAACMSLGEVGEVAARGLLDPLPI